MKICKDKTKQLIYEWDDNSIVITSNGEIAIDSASNPPTEFWEKLATFIYQIGEGSRKEVETLKIFAETNCLAIEKLKEENKILSEKKIVLDQELKKTYVNSGSTKKSMFIAGLIVGKKQNDKGK